MGEHCFAQTNEHDGDMRSQIQHTAVSESIALKDEPTLPVPKTDRWTAADQRHFL